MSPKLDEYLNEKKKLHRNTIAKELEENDDWLDEYLLDDETYKQMSPRRKIDMVDVTKVGTFVLIGGGIGLLSGVAAIVVSASVAEVVLGGVVTKVAGAVGGAAGLGFGINSIEKKNRRDKKGE